MPTLGVSRLLSSVRLHTYESIPFAAMAYKTAFLPSPFPTRETHFPKIHLHKNGPGVRYDTRVHPRQICARPGCAARSTYFARFLSTRLCMPTSTALRGKIGMAFKAFQASR